MVMMAGVNLGSKLGWYLKKKKSLIIILKEREMEKDTYSGMPKIIKLDSSILACT